MYFLDGKTKERISFISDVDCVPEGNTNNYRGYLSRQLYQSSDWDEFIESAHREECNLDNPNKNVYENIIESYYFKSGDTIYFRSKNISISCEDSFIANFIIECNRSGYFRNFLKSDCDLDEYSDYTETEPSKFFRLLIRFIEKGAKAMMLRVTEDIKPEDTKLANLTILGKNKVGRYFGKISYPFGDEYVNISKSTLDLIQYEYPDAVIIEPSEKKEDINFVPLHYFQLVIRLGLFSSVFNFKHLKKLYMQYNKDIFENRLDTKTICMAGNYSNNTKFKHESVSDCTAHTKNQHYITINGRHIDLQRSELSDFTKRTLIHEMCHSYTRVLYGTSEENPGEDGGTIYGLDEKHKSQWRFHGKHFGESVQFASDKTKIPFNQIFGYGLGTPYELEDSNGLTLAPKNAFDFGQRYRDTEAVFIKSGDFCPVHNKVNCSCNSDNKVPFSNSRYLGRCEKCGKLHTFNDITLKKLSKEPLSYMAVVDRYGIIATSKCEKCEGKLIPVFSSDDTNVKKYLEDLDYSNRYAEHMVDIYKQNITKYANYFKNNYGCDLEVSKSNMPCLSITISNKSGFKEVFKFFLSCSEKGKLVGKLYKDYGMEYKGAFIHKFRVDTDKNVLKLLEYIMKFIRKNLKES